MLPDEGPSPEQIEILRKMTMTERWQVAHDMYWSMRRQKAAFLRSQYPDWSDERIEATLRENFANARS